MFFSGVGKLIDFKTYHVFKKKTSIVFADGLGYTQHDVLQPVQTMRNTYDHDDLQTFTIHTKCWRVFIYMKSQQEGYIVILQSSSRLSTLTCTLILWFRIFRLDHWCLHRLSWRWTVRPLLYEPADWSWSNRSQSARRSYRLPSSCVVRTLHGFVVALI